MFKKFCIVLIVVLLFPVGVFPQQFFSTWIPMRDGKYLAADVYSPDTTQAFPVILIKTPYNKAWYQTHGLPLTTEDYAFVIVDWRGFFASESAAVPNPNRGEDGYDCVEWIAQQKWCNGKVGMWGISAVGAIQYQTEREHPPHLVCGVPIAADYMLYYEKYFRGGAMRTEYVQTQQMLGFDIALLLEHPVHDWLWNYVESVTNYPEEIDIPMLIMGGWYDHHSYSDGIFRVFNDLTTIGGINGRDHHKLILGPWHHCHIGDTVQGQLEYPNAAGVPEVEAIKFFDYWLRDIPNGYDTLLPIRYYQMGTDEWLSTENWPPDSVSPVTFYLHPAGSLSVTTPSNTYSPDTFFYDPRDPSPTIGGVVISPFLLQGPWNQSSVEQREDALVFSTSLLDEPLVVDGEPRVTLFVSSNRLDTDFTIRLCDVYPDGRSMLMMDGIRRMRFRESFESETLMTPGEIYQIEIKLPYTALTFLQEHRVRIIVSSSNYSRFDRNLNNGDSLNVPGDTLVALNRIYHDVNYPSALILPVKNSTGITEEWTKWKGQSAKLENYPNPFNSQTTITYQLPTKVNVNLKIYNVLGRKIRTLVNKNKPAGNHSVVWDGKNDLGRDVGSGVYFYQLKVGDKFSQIKKMLLLRQ